MDIITFTDDNKIKIEQPTVIFEGSLDQLRAEQAAIEERIGDFDQQIAEMEGERAKLIAARDEKISMLTSVQSKAKVERVELEAVTEAVSTK